MSRAWLSTIAHVTISISMVISQCPLAGDEPEIQFDVPALAAARELECTDDGQKIIEVLVPVSLIRLPERGHVSEIRVDVIWNRSSYPVVDYGPRTQLNSPIDGPVAVENKDETGGSFGIELSSGYLKVANAGVNLDLSKKNQRTTRYEEIPQHEVLVSSGTSQRGTGVSYRIRPSRTTTLEGGHDLVIAYMVPAQWRAGVLTVQCYADGTRSLFGSLHDSFTDGTAFVMPVYLKGDDQARQTAVDFVQTEQDLRSGWQSLTQQRRANRIGIPLSSLLGQRNTSAGIPDEWVHGLIQSGSDNWLQKYRRQLPPQIVTAANQFVEARRELLELGR